ncbi:MAG: ATP-dependent DNA ligase [archaeon]
MRYSEIAEIYGEIEATTKRLEMTDLLVKLLKKATKDEIDQVVYLTMGRLYPDYVGIELGIADKLAIRSIALNANVSEEDLLEDYKKSGDLGITAEKFASRKKQVKLANRTLSLSDVYSSFEKMAHAKGAGAVEQKIRALSGLLSDSSPQETRFIIRTALGQLRLGVADMTMLDALSVAYGEGKETREYLERAYNLSSDLGYVAKIVAESGIGAIKKFRIQVGRPIRPMLAERLQTASEILEKMGGIAAAEYKYDGLRLQAHVESRRVALSKQVTLFSRRLENVTPQFPDAAASIRESVRPEAAILEGECVAVDSSTGDLLPFQVISQRRGRKYDIEAKTEEIPVVVFVFDLLFADGKDYAALPYATRRKALEDSVQETEHVKLSRQIIIESPEMIDRYMDQAVSDGCEGLIVKSLSAESAYKAGGRGFLWIKYKREYKSEMTDTVDLVAIGAFAGRGRRAGTYGALLLAAYNRQKDLFETLCKCGSGFTDEDLALLSRKAKGLRIPHRHARVNSKIEPDVWLTPSMVLEVIGAEITVSPVHTCGSDTVRAGSGFAVRFPRFTGNYRDDKSPEDATTGGEILEMYQNQLKKITATI